MTETDNGDGNLPAQRGEQRLESPVIRTGMFGAHDTPDTSGYGRLRVYKAPPLSSEPPYGGYFDTIATVLQEAGLGLDDAIERVVVDRGEMTMHVKRDRLIEVAGKLRDDPALAFELCLGVSGVHYLDDTG
ncbi:MAG TPA: NADH-quinone oxidoreductase subunit C, partial [Streptosporangiaceae bacterium]|nr:NADH-quinone oxidoreductase subunit C [Streptosporangiaceae bacterium]